jgi:hypothetical protein
MVFQYALSCDVCEKNQPKILRGITHGTGPQGTLDYIIISVSALIVLATLIYFVKYLLWPGERDPKHIKRSIINEF